MIQSIQNYFFADSWSPLTSISVGLVAAPLSHIAFNYVATKIDELIGQNFRSNQGIQIKKTILVDKKHHGNLSDTIESLGKGKKNFRQEKIENLKQFATDNFRTCIFVPIFEECFFRGYFQPKCVNFFSPLGETQAVITGIFFTSLLFGLGHTDTNLGMNTYNIAIFVSSGISGTILSLLSQSSGNILASIFTHIGHNSISTFYTWSELKDKIDDDETLA